MSRVDAFPIPPTGPTPMSERVRLREPWHYGLLGQYFNIAWAFANGMLALGKVYNLNVSTDHACTRCRQRGHNVRRCKEAA